MSIERLYNQSATVYRATGTRDAIGGNTRTFVASGSAFRCRVRQLSATERQMSGGRGVALTHRLYCSAAVDVTEADEIHIGVIIYRVESVNNVDAANHHLEVDMSERRPDRNER